MPFCVPFLSLWGWLRVLRAHTNGVFFACAGPIGLDPPTPYHGRIPCADPIWNLDPDWQIGWHLDSWWNWKKERRAQSRENYHSRDTFRVTRKRNSIENQPKAATNIFMYIITQRITKHLRNTQPDIALKTRVCQKLAHWDNHIQAAFVIARGNEQPFDLVDTTLGAGLQDAVHVHSGKPFHDCRESTCFLGVGRIDEELALTLGDGLTT